jgi:hypothetical protein
MSAAVADRIGDFVISLSEDPRKLEAFQQDPRAVLEASGISEEIGQMISTAEGLYVAAAPEQAAPSAPVPARPTVVVVVVVAAQ